ncbi:alpha/beta hydrolase [Pseudonocardia spinosispora]|uniref:alpha/beta hydrolase n=1 Tax=Pseudonocardia spinosispora TaxID=103441 RepID=UPI0004025F31|nr:alpha/beta hydrolase [Pseudonocardia spinosispora]
MPRTEQTTFPSGDGQCTAWVTLPPAPGPHPAVLLIHGFGATHEMALAHYEQRFSEAGMAVVSFDYRFTGASPGEPRQLIRVRHLLTDVEAALRFTRSLPSVDPDRTALWGTSFGASHAMVVASRHPEIAGLVVNCPMIDGLNAALRLGPAQLLRLLGPVTSDLLRRAPRYVPMVGEPGEFALINSPGAKAGWYSLIPEGSAWDNRCAAAVAVDLLHYRAVRVAPRVECPFLVCVSDNETLMDPAIAVRAARRAPKGRAIHYPSDHFQVYHPPLVDQVVADQTTFLCETLRLPAGV